MILYKINIYLNKTARSILILAVLLFSEGVLKSQCNMTITLSDQNDLIRNEILIVSNNGKKTYLVSNEIGKIHLNNLACDSTLSLELFTPLHEQYDTVLQKPNDLNVKLNLKKFMSDAVVLDTIKFLLPSNGNLNTEVLNESISNQNFQNSSQLFEQFTAINSTSRSSTIQKPILRQFHSQRLSILEHKLPIRDQTWGIDHGLETGLAHIYDIDYSTNAQNIYSDYAALSLNNNVFDLPKTSFVGTSYNSVNQKKSISFQLNKQIKHNSWMLSSDLEKSENIRVNTDKYRYLSSTYKLNDKQLSNTGRDKYSVYLDYKHKENLSIGVYNINSQTGFFQGSSGLPSSYPLINSKQILLPSQKLNHFKAHAHYKKEKNKAVFSSDIALQNNTRKEFEKAGFHGYNPYLLDSLGILMSFKNLDWLNTYNLHIDSTWRVKIEHSVNAGINKVSGFDFIIPGYKLLENRAAIFIEYAHNPKIDYTLVLSGENKIIKTDEKRIDVYQNKNYIGQVEVAKASSRSFSNIDLLFMSKQVWNKYLGSNFSFGTAARAPEINELHAYGLHHGTYRFEKGNQNLNNERNFNAQFEITYHRKKIKWVNALYVYHFENFIYLSPSNQFASATINGNLISLASTGQGYDYVQNRVRMNGLESELIIKDKAYESKSSIFFTRSINLNTYLPLPFTAQSSFKQQLSYTLTRKNNTHYQSKVIVNYTHFFAQNRIDKNENITPSGNKLNVLYEFSILNRKNKINLNFGVENLLNQNYYIHISEYRALNIPEPKRNIFFGINVRF